MFDMLSRFLPAQETDEREIQSTIRTLRTIVIVAMLGALMSFAAALSFGGTPQALVIMSFLFLLLLAGLFALNRGVLWPAQILTPLSLFATVTFLILVGNGLHDIAFFAYSGVIIVASLTLGQRAAFVFAGLIIIATVGIGIAELQGVLVNPGSHLTSIDTPIFATILILAITFTQRALTSRLNDSLQRARLNEQEQVIANQRLRELQATLESRVEERTTELENRNKDLDNANTQIQRRAAQFEALAQVTQSITSVRDLQQLLPRVTTVISENFNFYHTGIFQLDALGEYAVLVAANSAGGQKMLARRHRLRVGEEGIVGYAAFTAKPRIALDVGQDAVYFNNPDLPETHSEVALPLISNNIIVGVLDVQSTEVAAFSNEDIQMLSLLADQVSLAIENARLFEDTRRALSEAEMASRRATREAWERLHEQQDLIGFRYDISGAAPLKQLIKLDGTEPALDKSDRTGASQTVVPIALRGETIGNLIVQSASGEQWEQDQLDLIQAVAERIALSAENARLFEETTARADRERLVSEITGKIRSHNNPQAMIQTALDELRTALGASRVEVLPQSVKAAEKKDT